MNVDLGTIEIVAGLTVLLLVAPLLQFWTLKLGLNGMREDVKEIKKDVKTVVMSDAVHEQQIVSLEARMKKVEN